MNNRIKTGAGWVGIAVSIVGAFEGLRTVAYLDPVGIPTICFGETKGVKMGDRATRAECDGMLADSLHIANRQVSQCTRVPLSDSQRAALVSFTYNVGGGAYCSSTLARKLNAGQYGAVCGELAKWKYAKGVPLPGLARRRAAECDLFMGRAT